MDTNILTPEQARPLKRSDYIQEILIPEAAARLIAIDRNIPLDEAYHIMRQSVEFGNYMQDVQQG